MRTHFLPRAAALALPALLALGSSLLPSGAGAASNVQIIGATLSPATPCASADATLTVTLEDVSGASFTPYLYAASQFASVACGSGFPTDEGIPQIGWVVYAGVDPSSPGTDIFTGAWPDDGGWEAPVTLSYTGQTYTVDFTVQIPGSDDAASAQTFQIGASSSPQGASGADSYYCLPYETCPTEGSMVPTGTASPTPGAGTPSPTPTQQAGGPGPALPTATPSPAVSPSPSPDGTAAEPKAQEGTEGCGLSVLPNLVLRAEAVHIVAQACVSGMAKLSILRENGRAVLEPIQHPLAAGQQIDFYWTGLLADGAPAASGIYYVVFTDGDGRHDTRKLLIVR